MFVRLKSTIPFIMKLNHKAGRRRIHRGVMIHTRRRCSALYSRQGLAGLATTTLQPVRTQPRLPEAGKVDPINSPRLLRPTAVCTAPRLKLHPINSPRELRLTAVCTAPRLPEAGKLHLHPVNSPRELRPTAVCTAPRLKVDPINSPRELRLTAVCTAPRLPEAGKLHLHPVNSPRELRPTAVCTAPRLKVDPINSPRELRLTAVCTAPRLPEAGKLHLHPLNSPRELRPTAVCTAPRLKVDPINSPRVLRPTAVCTAPRLAACSGSVAPPAARASSALTSTAAGRGGRRGTGHVWPGTAPPPCRAKPGEGGSQLYMDLRLQLHRSSSSRYVTIHLSSCRSASHPFTCS